MNVTVLRTYAVQLEEVAKLELTELVHALQHTSDRMAMLEARAREDADRYLVQVGEGSTVAQAYSHLDSMDQAIATRKDLEQAHAAQQTQMEQKRGELLEAMQYRKKLDLLDARIPDARLRKISAALADYCQPLAGRRMVRLDCQDRLQQRPGIRQTALADRQPRSLKQRAGVERIDFQNIRIEAVGLGETLELQQALRLGEHFGDA